MGYALDESCAELDLYAHLSCCSVRIPGAHTLFTIEEIALASCIHELYNVIEKGLASAVHTAVVQVIAGLDRVDSATQKLLLCFLLVRSLCTKPLSMNYHDAKTMSAYQYFWLDGEPRHPHA